MSILTVFQELTGITDCSVLEIGDVKSASLVDKIKRDHCLPLSRERPVRMAEVKTYVHQADKTFPGFAMITPALPPFASHWGVVVGDPNDVATLYHLVLKTDDDGNRAVLFVPTAVTPESHWIQFGTMKDVGFTEYDHEDRIRIGKKMIKEFGNYHCVFWNCQTFAKCYLAVITDNAAVFDNWTAADTTALFLCAFTVTIPIVASSKATQRARATKVIKESKALAVAREGTESMSGPPDSSDVRSPIENIWQASDDALTIMWDATISDRENQQLHMMIKNPVPKTGLFRELFTGWKTLLFGS
jgi:hypothetical protein